VGGGGDSEHGSNKTQSTQRPKVAPLHLPRRSFARLPTTQALKHLHALANQAGRNTTRQRDRGLAVTSSRLYGHAVSGFSR
jgi:hypothetical protein